MSEWYVLMPRRDAEARAAVALIAEEQRRLLPQLRMAERWHLDTLADLQARWDELQQEIGRWCVPTGEVIHW